MQILVDKDNPNFVIVEKDFLSGAIRFLGTNLSVNILKTHLSS